MKKTVKIVLMGESHIDPAPIYCLRQYISLLLQAKIPVKLAGEFECDKTMREMQEWFTNVTTFNNKLLADPILKPHLTIKGKRQYFQNTDAAKYALSVAYKKPGDAKVVHEFSLYLLQQERMIEALRLFEIIEKQKISFIGIDRPKSFTEEMLRKHGKTNAVAFNRKMHEERESHMLTQIINGCVKPLLIELGQSTNENAIGVICVYMGPVHVHPVMEKIKLVSLGEDVKIEIIPFAVFSDTVFDEVQKNTPIFGLSLPTQQIKVNESSEGIFDIRACIDFLSQNLPEVSFSKKVTANNQFAEGLTELLPWAEVTTHYFLNPEDNKGDITNYTVDVSIKTINSHQHKYLTQFFKPLEKHVSSNPAKTVVTVKDVNVYPREMHKFIHSR